MILAIFDRCVASAKAGSVPDILSDPIQVSACKVVVSGILINAIGTYKQITLSIEGSYDGMVYYEVPSAYVAVGTVPGSGASPIVTIDYAYIRIRAQVNQGGGDSTALFSAWLVFES